MATSGLLDFLAGDALTKVAQGLANNMGVVRPYPAEYYAGVNNPVPGVTVSYDLETASREAAPIVNPDSQPVTLQGVATVNKKVAGLGSRASYTIPIDLIQSLQFPGDIVRMNAMNELERQMRNHVEKFVTLRSDTVHSALIRGKVDVSSAGLVQTTTSSPVRWIDYAIPTGNQLTAAGGGSTYAIGDWSSAGTDIVTAVSELKRYAAKTYSMQIGVCEYGVDVPGFLAKNTAFKEYLARNPQFNTNYVSTGEIPDGVLGLKWIPVGTATKVASGTGTSFAADNFLAFSPPLSTGWFQVYNCGLPAPTGVASEADFVSALTSADQLVNKFPIRYGMHAYTVYNARNLSAELIVADFHAPIIKSPNARYFGVCS